MSISSRGRRAAVAVGLTASLATAGVLVATTADASSTTTKTVKLSGMQFSPRSVSISKGSKVKFVWAGGGHNLVGHGVKTKVMSSGSKTLTFHSAGTYKYICQVHQNMSMTVVVH